MGFGVWGSGQGEGWVRVRVMLRLHAPPSLPALRRKSGPTPTLSTQTSPKARTTNPKPIWMSYLDLWWLGRCLCEAAGPHWLRLALHGTGSRGRLRRGRQRRHIVVGRHLVGVRGRVRRKGITVVLALERAGIKSDPRVGLRVDYSNPNPSRLLSSGL